VEETFMGQRTLWVVATIIAVGTLSVGLAKHWPSTEAGTIAAATTHERTARAGRPLELASEPKSAPRSVRFDRGGAGDGALLAGDDPESSGKRGHRRFERFVEEAQLTPQQREMLLGAIAVEREKLAELRAEPTGDHEARRAAIKAIRSETNRAAKQVLDVDQFEQYQQRRHRAAERRRARRDEPEKTP
jgi:hypothetical protein